MYKEIVFGNEIKIEANMNEFSPKNIDKGTQIMLKNISFHKYDKVLDLACGSGIVGISIAKKLGAVNVFLSDVDEFAVSSAKNNAVINGLSELTIIQSNGLIDMDVFNFTIVLCNPPYHTDFSVAKEFIEDSKRHLTMNGELYIVVKRVKWYREKMNSVFGNVKVIEENGYYVIISRKNDEFRRVNQKKKINKKHQKKIEKSKMKRCVL